MPQLNNVLQCKSKLIKQANCCLTCKSSYMAIVGTTQGFLSQTRPTPACRLHNCPIESSDWCKHYSCKFKEDGNVYKG